MEKVIQIIPEEIEHSRTVASIWIGETSPLEVATIHSRGELNGFLLRYHLRIEQSTWDQVLAAAQTWGPIRTVEEVYKKPPLESWGGDL